MESRRVIRIMLHEHEKQTAVLDNSRINFCDKARKHAFADAPCPVKLADGEKQHMTTWDLHLVCTVPSC